MDINITYSIGISSDIDNNMVKKIEQPPVLHYFDVKVECMLPATLTYRVLAEDAQQAVEKTKGLQPNSVQHKLIGRKELKIRVYDAGSSILKWMKNLMG